MIDTTMNKEVNYDVAITTEDNPFDPLADFDNWFNYDEEKGYHTCAYLARVAVTSNGLSDLDNDLAVEAAIDEIIDFNLLGNYKKVVRPRTNNN